MNNKIITTLKISQFNDKLILNKPEDIATFDGIEFDVSIKKTKYDLVFAFIFSLDEFSETVNMLIKKDLINPNGCFFYAYPKKGNKKYKEYIGRDDFFKKEYIDDEGFINNSHLKFFKMLAFDDVFTCIGLRHETKKETKSSKPSQCVGDYVDRIPDLQKHFANNKTVLDFYNNLTPGYQRDWARYVFSAQTETTIQKRLAEMEMIIGKGYKSKDLYRQSKK